MNIKQKRIDLNMTQIDAAKYIGVPLSTFILWERGASTPNKKNAEKLEAFLKSNGKVDK